MPHRLDGSASSSSRARKNHHVGGVIHLELLEPCRLEVQLVARYERRDHVDAAPAVRDTNHVTGTETAAKRKHAPMSLDRSGGIGEDSVEIEQHTRAREFGHTESSHPSSVPPGPPAATALAG